MKAILLLFLVLLSASVFYTKGSTLNANLKSKQKENKHLSVDNRSWVLLDKIEFDLCNDGSADTIYFRTDSLFKIWKEPGDFHSVLIKSKNNKTTVFTLNNGWIKFGKKELTRLNPNICDSSIINNAYSLLLNISPDKKGLLLLEEQMPTSEESFTIVLFSKDEKPKKVFNGEYYIYNILDLDGDNQKELICILYEKNEDRHFAQYIVLSLNEDYQVNKKLSFQYNLSLRSYRRCPESSLRLLCEKDVENMPKETLRIIRNEMYADHGYVFKTEEMKKYFENKSWYKPRYSDINTCIYFLSDVEKINIEFLKQKEKELH